MEMITSEHYWCITPVLPNDWDQGAGRLTRDSLICGGQYVSYGDWIFFTFRS